MKSLIRKGLFCVPAALLAVATILTPKPAWAWASPGHMMVADIAWEDLGADPQTRPLLEKMTKILEALPDKAKTIEAGVPTTMPSERHAMYIFVQAATWPDIIRDKGNKEHGEHRPTWHYIDFPINHDGVTGPVQSTDLPANPDWAALAADAQSPLDAVQALKVNEALLKSAGTPDDRRAIALCWYLHLVGDIHQPLHAVSFYSKDFPNGDKGGNAFLVSDNGRQTNLHSLWDQYPSATGAAPANVQRVAEWATDPSLSRQKMSAEIANGDYAAWAHESQALAIKYCYDDIHGANGDRIKQGEKIPVPILPQNYDKESLKVVHHQIFLAGHRLAEKLREIFK